MTDCLHTHLRRTTAFATNGKVRRIPFEVMVRGDKVPVYEETLEGPGPLQRAAGAAI